ANLISGAAVAFGVEGGNNTLSATSAMTNVSGVATTSLKSTRAETKIITATAAGVAFNTNVVFYAGAPAAATTTFVVNPNSNITADGNATAAFSLRVNDAFGNAAGGQNVTVSATGASNTFPLPASGQTDANGYYLFPNLAAGAYTVTFTTPGGFVPTIANQGSDVTDSDPVAGVVNVSLAAGQNNLTIDAGFKVPVCTSTTNHTETFPNKFNTYFTTSLYNKTFTGSSGTWKVNSNNRATMVVTTPYYSPSTSYALKVVNYNTSGCGSGWTKAESPKVDLSNPCCPSELKMNFTLWTYKVVCNDSKAKLEIDFSRDNGVTWTEVWSKSSGQLYSSYGVNKKVNIAISVPVAYQNANFKYRIRGEMASGDCNNFYVFIDDIKIGSPASCSSSSYYSARTTTGNGSLEMPELGEAAQQTESLKLERESLAEKLKVDFNVAVYP
ncbi:MAG: hypothetical protein EOP49_39730, partial [Sphingobacteriales bacterium]